MADKDGRGVKAKASLKMDDAFNPKHMEFTEGDKTIEFFTDGESIRLQCYRGSKKDRESFQMGMRLPLYARTAFAQMFTHALNGGSLYPKLPAAEGNE